MPLILFHRVEEEYNKEKINKYSTLFLQLQMLFYKEKVSWKKENKMKKQPREWIVRYVFDNLFFTSTTKIILWTELWNFNICNSTH